MSISDRILRRILARIERQSPIPQVDGLHGQHTVSLPAADWPYLIDAVTKLDDWRCAQTPRLVEVTAALRGLWLVTACGTDGQRLEALTVAGDLLASMDGFAFEAASPADAQSKAPADPNPSHPMDSPRREK